jgi:hypothetical protein
MICEGIDALGMPGVLRIEVRLDPAYVQQETLSQDFNLMENDEFIQIGCAPLDGYEEIRADGGRQQKGKGQEYEDLFFHAINSELCRARRDPVQSATGFALSA